MSLSGDLALIGVDRTEEACPENQNCESGSAPIPKDVYDEFRATYTGLDLLKTMDFDLDIDVNRQHVDDRNHASAYDELNQLKSSSIDSTEWGGSSTRPFTYTPALNLGQYTRVGPDGMETFAQLGAANRVSFVRRGPAANPLMTASYLYYANGQVNSITYANGAQTLYLYDVASRITGIDHRDASGATIRSLSYTAYTDNDLPLIVFETEAGGGSWQTTYAYDNRSRLIRELGELSGGVVTFDFNYEYDQGGNRTRKQDLLHDVEVVYHYDIEQPCKYGTDDNRLVYYDTLSSIGGAVASTSYYYYNCSGNVTRIITNATGSNDFSATRFVYAKNEQTVTYVMGETWDSLDPTGTYDITYAKQFRYDGARQRYLNRDLNLVKLKQTPPVFEAIENTGDTWSDYDGNDIYGDFDSVGVNLRSYEPGIARITDPLGTPVANYYRANHLGTTRTTSDDAGGSTPVRAKTAFGEPLTGEHDRYGYVGAWGYQAHTEFSQLHVGARYYDAASGRFLQRDPIGIDGGLNVYAYVRSTPTVGVDPDGLFSIFSSRSPVTSVVLRGRQGGLNQGKLRVGRSSVKLPGYRKWGKRFALRYRGLHIYGARAAVATGAMVCAAGAVGYGVGTAINHAPRLFNKPKLSDTIGGFLFRTCPSCFSIGL